MDRHAAPKKPAQQDWHKADIKAALEKAGWSLRALAGAHDLAHGSVAQAFKGPYPAAERRIASALGMKPEVIWPSRYDSTGKPNRRRGNSKRVAASTSRNGSTGKSSRHVKSAGRN